MKKVKLSFQTKMLLPVLVTVIIAFMVTGVSVYTAFKKEVTSLAQTNAWSIANKAADSISNVFLEALTAADGLADTAELITVNNLDEEQIFNYLNDVASKHSGFNSVYIIWDSNKYGPAVNSENGRKVNSMLDPASMVGPWYEAP